MLGTVKNPGHLAAAGRTANSIFLGSYLQGPAPLQGLRHHIDINQHRWRRSTLGTKCCMGSEGVRHERAVDKRKAACRTNL